MRLFSLSVICLAQVTGSGSLLEESISQIEAIQLAWDKHWDTIFTGMNGLYVGINQFATIILVGTFIFFAVGWVKDAIERGIFPALHHVLWIFVIAVLLHNNGNLLGSITLGIRNVINDQTKTVLEIQVGDITMLEALNDVVVSQQAKDVIQQQYADCEAKEGQAQVDCIVDAGRRVESILEREYRDTGY